ncbi:polyhydroxyalkanoate synthesis repressor PhaR [Algiphilus sp.]|uniref:polyhydroxyalkanoate synthesis repressor PhaR n=1 Tax=Algiphilus sp. TaxID=1872431 RepID=UPI002A614A70|nr:polyhydroxyalkanoate synthesis repressor PhaR [Pseudomonadota bacterium]
MTAERIIRKYPNRRLYDTAQARFINLDDLRQMVVDGEEFVVQDKSSGRDITRSMLLQIIVEAEESGEPLLSTRMLRNMIRFYGHIMQSAFGHYIEAATEQFMQQQDTVERQFKQLMSGGPMAAMNDLLRAQMGFFGKKDDGSGDSKK